MILVVGATGMVGSEICQKLAGRKEKVRGLIRATSSAEKVELLRKCGSGDAIDMTQVQKQFGIVLTSIDQYARNALSHATAG